jgi:predicted DNA-binding protein (UPF0251 family)
MHFHPTTIARFWTYVRKDPDPDGCWLWIGTSDHHGYGHIHEHKRYYQAHRFSWLIHAGAIPERLFVCHHCDVPLCVNPAHLFIGTHSDNMRDAARKGRMAAGIRSGQHTHPESRPYGERNGNAKLTESDIPHIRLLLNQGISQGAVARLYGINKKCIWRIAHGIAWTQVR